MLRKILPWLAWERAMKRFVAGECRGREIPRIEVNAAGRHGPADPAEW
jgi:hypothetical protein